MLLDFFVSKTRRSGSSARTINISAAKNDGFDLDVAAFALDADKTGIEGALGGFVHEFSVDEGRDLVVQADGLGRVPFADGIFRRWAAHRDRRVFVHAFMFFGFRAGHQKQIALPVVSALDLNALRPDFVGQLHVDEHAGVVEFRCHFDEAPDDGEKIIAVNLRRAQVADGLAGAMNDAIRHAPGLERSGIVLHAKSEAGKILAVE
jgi:hypothetical protein